MTRNERTSACRATSARSSSFGARATSTSAFACMRGAVVLGAVVLGACGYRPLHGGSVPPGGGEHLHVVLLASKVPDAIASDEVVSGVREELARMNALATGDGYPRCEVEVLRADEAAEGVAATPNVDGRLIPESRATRTGLVARAWVVDRAGGERHRDTGDMRVIDTVAVAPDARTATFQNVDALRAAGRRVGHRLGLRILGLPTTSED